MLLLTDLGTMWSCKEQLHGSILSIAGQNWDFKARWNLFSIFWDKTDISGHRVRSWLPSIMTSLGTTSVVVAPEKDMDWTFTVPNLGE